MPEQVNLVDARSLSASSMSPAKSANFTIPLNVGTTSQLLAMHQIKTEML